MAGVSLFSDDDRDLERVVAYFESIPNCRGLFGEVFRQAFDEVLDGQRTGRYCIEDLEKTEKTYVGTKVEILLREALALPKGSVLDFVIEGIEIDCKFSLGSNWMIPVEARNRLCLLLSADEVRARQRVGVMRCVDEILNKPNRDRKSSIRVSALERAAWILWDAPMPENLLRSLPTATLDRIFFHTGKRDGQKRIDELFRLVHGRIVRREVTVTVARQHDGMKRARDARHRLRDEGIVILGHQEGHPRIAADLGLPVPTKGEFVAVRLVPVSSPEGDVRTTTIGGTGWRVAGAEDPVVAAPAEY